MISAKRTRLHSQNDIDKIVAQNREKLDRLCWCVEVRWSSSRTLSGKVELLIAAFPGRFIPLIRVGCRPEISRHEADLLLELIRYANHGRGFEYGLGLIDINSLGDDTAAYEWGAVEWDCVCKICATVFQSTNAGALRCQQCIEIARREPRRKGWNHAG